MISNENIGNILKILQKYVKNIPEPAIEKISNKYNSSFHILISTLLSARTKDATTIKVCQNLFKKIKNNQDLIKINKTTLQKLLYPVGFYKIKTKHLKELSLILKKKFNDVPDTIDGLLTLPGVGRKTANLVLILAFNKYGICVDTHVHRIVNRWQYIHTRTPDDTEQALRKKLPKPYWKTINNILVSYGKVICKPVNPLCQQCKINQYCPYPKKI